MTENTKHLYLIFAFNEMSWYEIWHGYDLPEAIGIFNNLTKYAGKDLELRSTQTALDYHEWQATKPDFNSFIEICKLHRSSTSAG